MDLFLLLKKIKRGDPIYSLVKSIEKQRERRIRKRYGENVYRVIMGIKEDLLIRDFYIFKDNLENFVIRGEFYSRANGGLYAKFEDVEKGELYLFIPLDSLVDPSDIKSRGSNYIY
ncbi:MAG: hypothetical protein QW273_01570 [Candidatus Pacearchaeota archaeon]